MMASYAMRNSGFSLMEVLISVLVLSVGLLGLAGLHVTSIRGTHSSFYRSQATILAYEIADRMRANPLQARAGSYNEEHIATYSSDDTSQAATDLAHWKSSLGEIFPSFDGSIDCQSDGDCLVVVQWDDSRAERKSVVEEDEGEEETSTTRWEGSQVRQFQMRTRI